MKRAFTLIELLIVISIITLMLATLLPAFSRIRMQAKVLTANSDLRQIGICLDMYTVDNNNRFPPTRKDCNLGWEDHQLPPELVESGYLPEPESSSNTSAGIYDVFNHNVTYKYWSVGQMYQNGKYSERLKSGLYVPKNFPANNEEKPETDIYYNAPDLSPVNWVIYSEGPNYDAWTAIKELNGPVPRRCWYDPAKNEGLIVRISTKNGDQIGTFQE
ncbi:MAG: type II secretion system protein [Sedimentisphaeraceae bacterium JB056]